jgi:hypothetical protein
VMPRSKFLFLVVLTALSFKTPAFSQENQGTPEQRAACSPDAFRLCGSYIPDPTSVESCLRQKQSELSPPCRSVFGRSAPTTGGSRAYKGIVSSTF